MPFLTIMPNERNSSALRRHAKINPSPVPGTELYDILKNLHNI